MNEESKFLEKFTQKKLGGGGGGVGRGGQGGCEQRIEVLFFFFFFFFLFSSLFYLNSHIQCNTFEMNNILSYALPLFLSSILRY